jgi:hypothetical protein
VVDTPRFTLCVSTLNSWEAQSSDVSLMVLGPWYLDPLADEQQEKTNNSVAWVCEPTVPIEQTQLVGEVIANFLRIEKCRVVNSADPLRP